MPILLELITMMRFTLISLLGIAVSQLAIAAEPVDFANDVKPIFARSCLSCHGPDKQKSGYRLDRKADALKGGDLGPKAIAPGKSAASPLIRYVSGVDAQVVMPPDRKKLLTAAEVAILKAWIDQGASWPDDGSTIANSADWWSLKPIRKPTLPKLSDADKAWVRTPIDAFIVAKLREKGLKPSPEADRRTLIRRATFDLIGLPPTFEDVEAFANDPDPLAYEKLIDRLLASPRYGERWARHWLDVVHYGETHGYDKDQPRPNAWPYRDYVIRAFNHDKPYGRFVKEQVAGDVLFPGTPDGIEALGFIAAGPWDFIGHAEVPETKIDGKVARHLDRDDMIANTIGTFQSLTVHCAQCHNHKFDPIPQVDYYRLQAVFAALDRADKAYDSDPQIAAKRLEVTARRTAIRSESTAFESKLIALAVPAMAELDRRIALAGRDKPQAAPAEYGYHSAISPKQDAAKWVQIDLGKSIAIEKIVIRPCNDDFNGIGAGFGFPLQYKVEISNDPTFREGVSKVIDKTTADATNPGTAPQTFAIEAMGHYVRFTATKLAPRMNDYMLALAELEVLTADGKNAAAGRAVAAFDSIEAPPRWRKSNLTDGLYAPHTDEKVGSLAELKARREALLVHVAGPDGAKQLAELRAELAKFDVELQKLPPQKRVYAGTIHTGSGAFAGTGAAGGKPRPIYLLPRGDVTKPTSLVPPGTLSAVTGPTANFELPNGHSEGDRRAALANWLADEKNPLTWRSMVNRVWLYHMGRGIVDTPNDFGKMGQLPTHPELLDWLAAEFRDNGQSLKKLHRVIMASAVYRQSAAAVSAFDAIDGSNAYYWHMTRRKLEAEAVRDSVLFVSGKLDLKMGGPSFQDFKVERPEHSPHYEYHLHDANDPASHRRSVYRFVVRSKPQPWLAAFDCADPSQAVDKRNQTITPQQALALLNNQLTVMMAEHFAARVTPLGKTTPERIAAAMRLAFARNPTAADLAMLTKYAEDHGLANACRVILNLNEFAFVE